MGLQYAASAKGLLRITGHIKRILVKMVAVEIMLGQAVVVRYLELWCTPMEITVARIYRANHIQNLLGKVDMVVIITVNQDILGDTHLVRGIMENHLVA